MGDIIGRRRGTIETFGASRVAEALETKELFVPTAFQLDGSVVLLKLRAWSRARRPLRAAATMVWSNEGAPPQANSGGAFLLHPAEDPRRGRVAISPLYSPP